jgi:hypothetical protein
MSIRVLKGAEGFPSQKAFEREILGAPLFLGNRLLINIQCGPAIRMTE